MQKKKMPDFTTDHVFHDDGRFEFRCVHDVAARPWLSLHPHNPMFLQALNFWVPFEAGLARGHYGPEKWTALTETRWECGKRDVGKPVRGIASPVNEDDGLSYGITLYDDGGAEVYRLSGKGVIFQNRDFGAWRAGSKAKIAALPKPNEFEFAPHELTGAGAQSQSFISPIRNEETPSATALVTEKNGFIPHHPYLSGSGDHVNATHLHVIGEQFTSLLEGGRKFVSTSGTMAFNRFVEIGHPITVKLNKKSEGVVDLSFYQAENICAGMTFNYAFCD